MKAYTKDIAKTIWKGKKRFCAIMLIAALGVCMLACLKASCDDLRYSADEFFDKQNLMDIMVVSTMGLTEEDIEALARIEGIEDVEGTFSETVFTYVDGQTKQAAVKVLSQKGINMPYILEGEMPLAPDEILVTRDYVSETGLGIGDKIVIEEDMESEDEEPEVEEESKVVVKSGDVEENTEISESTETEEDSEDDEDLEIEIEEEEEEPNFLITEYTIVGVVIDVMDINSNEGAIAFRANSNTDYTFFVLPEAVESDVYTAIYLTLTGTDELLCYSDDYEARVDLFVQILEEEIKENREQSRYDEITGEANDKINDAEDEINDKLSDAEDKINDALQEIEDARQELADGEADLIQAEKDLAKAERELAKAQRELERAERQLAEAREELKDGWDELEAGEAAIEEGEKALDEAEKELENTKKELDEAEKELDDAEAEIPGQFSTMKTMLNGQLINVKADIMELEPEVKTLEQEVAELQAERDELTAKQDAGTINTFEQMRLVEVELQLAEKEPTLALKQEQLASLKEQQIAYEDSLADLEQQEADAYQQIEEGRADIAEGREEIANGEKEIAENREELEKNKKELADGRVDLEKAQKEYDDAKAEVEDGWEELEDGWEELEDARQEIEDGWAELEDGKAELEEGESELDANISEYEDKKSEAEDLIADAREEIEELKMAEWYISTRTSLSGYNNIKTDAQCIEAIGNAFPVLFLTIAILVSLTTISRMVEEDRGLIGTYKALGFTDREIQRKYVVYALLACILGGLLGLFLGFVVLPNILFIIFGVMYQIEDYVLRFNWLYGIGGIILFIIGIVGASVLSCRSELSKMPATLMRPKAPKNGSRVFLERFPSIWSKLSFLNKVTVRNLFRYKKRLFMTLFGIAGCTSLLVAGFTIKDTVTELMYKQYGDAYIYDSMVIAEDQEALLEHLEGDESIRSFLNVHVSNIKLINEAGKEETLQIMVVPEGSTLRGYINLYNEKDETLRLEDGTAYVTINATNLLGIAVGDMVSIQTMELDMAEIEVTDIAMNYLGNFVYMTQGTYEEMFDVEFEGNAALIRMKSDASKHEAWAENLSKQDGILSASSSAGFEEAADQVFRILNLVVYIVITLAAALAFVVLFTLATTNISERERELATIKVLGFFDKEVHLYVNKETLILTSLGIVMGLPIGKVFGEWLMSILDMPSIYFDPHLYPISYFYSAGLAIVFAFMVNFITDRSLDRINPVEALKSIE